MYVQTDLAAEMANTIMGVFATFSIFLLIYAVLCVIANWRIFSKAKQPGWAAIVPFYNSYILHKITWGNGWMFLAPIVLSFFVGIPLIGFLLAIISLVIQVLTCHKLSVAFGKGIGFTVGLVLLGPIFQMILGFGSAEYRGVPQDGCSFKQMEAKIKKTDAKCNDVTFEQPEEKTTSVEYESPDEK